ncbi:H-NS histone family protein [Xinfangfangia sp. D13-10-4-6]|uniref:H-NS histone family protein n=1 Tax=Pseudogemmobacter hezensis TaxID=2737662 RepID=UPI001557266E|nr:H-NS histone family protein [Pseudogemmobacter hezensis]NPD14287.1 H-NS histone family protein [Pseudogemmobacter hezensis]
MELDLNTLDLKELKSLQTRVARAIATFEDRRKKEALSKLDEAARELGFASLAELTGTAAPRKRAAVEAKYANPANPAETWSGRGRKPRWFAAALAGGKSESDLLI